MTMQNVAFVLYVPVMTAGQSYQNATHRMHFCLIQIVMVTMCSMCVCACFAPNRESNANALLLCQLSARCEHYSTTIHHRVICIIKSLRKYFN